MQDFVQRNADKLQEYIVAGVRSLMADNRPLFTQKLSEKARLQRLLEAPPEFWAKLETTDLETAAALAASVIRARQEGKIPDKGPLAGSVTHEDAKPTELAPQQESVIQ